MKIKFLNEECTVRKGFYATSKKGDAPRIALSVSDAEGFPIAKATVNLPDEPIESNHVFVKDYSENEGMYKALLDGKVIEPAIRVVPTGHVQVYVCKCLI